MGMPAGSFKPDDIDFFHDIRDVSGTSHMFGSSFRLPYDVAMGLVGPPPPDTVYSNENKEDEKDEAKKKSSKDGEIYEKYEE